MYSKVFFLFLLLIGNTVLASINLQEAEQFALDYVPELKAQAAEIVALEETAIAAGQLSDPTLRLSALNLPVDTFNVDQEPMTQLQIALEQTFPAGKTRHFKQYYNQQLADSERAKYDLLIIETLKGLRLNWVKLRYWIETKTIVLEQVKIFEHLLKVSESFLANNKAQQKDVVRAQFEVQTLINRLTTIEQHIKTAYDELARWVGPEASAAINPAKFPNWDAPPSREVLQHMLADHPRLLIDKALITANHTQVKIAKEQYKPGYKIGIGYGFRQGNNIDGSSRPDFLTAQLTMDLPIFTKNRQSKLLGASNQHLITAEQTHMSHYNQLKANLDATFTAWEQQAKVVTYYDKKLIPTSEYYSKATLSAYQNNLTDFDILADAYVMKLETKLTQLNAKLAKAMARITLLYYEE